MAAPYYRSYFPATYNYTPYNPIPQYNPVPQQQQQQPENRAPVVNGFSWVDGINAAKAQNINYGSSWIFFDTKEPYFYIKTVDPDGRPQPLFIASYKQINENELPTQESSSKPVFDLSGYVRKEDLDMSKYVTKEDIAKLIDTIATNNKNFLTHDSLEEEITQILQNKIGAPKPLQKLTIKEEE